MPLTPKRDNEKSKKVHKSSAIASTKSGSTYVGKSVSGSGKAKQPVQQMTVARSNGYPMSQRH